MVCSPQPVRYYVRRALQCVTVFETPMVRDRYTEFRTLPAVGFHEEIEGGPGFGLRFRLPDIMQVALGFGLHRFGHGVENVSGLVNPTALFPGAAEDFAQRRPEPP